jgi:LAO/AO transport system kinase
VLTVDPSSARTGGSILGDKTRMTRLAGDSRAYIRPSPASGALGGVARMTRETMLLCEAAGFDVVLVETVGVGQSETLVAEMVDMFVALMLPGAGDELQGIKKGIVELADLIAVNKADGDGMLAAQLAVAHYGRALAIIEPRTASWRPPVLAVSALTGQGVDELWATVERHRQILGASGERAANRRQQQVRWFWSLLDARLIDRLRRHPDVAKLLPGLELQVADAEITPTLAAERALAVFAGS